MGYGKRFALLIVPLLLLSLAGRPAETGQLLEFDPHRVIIKFRPGSKQLARSLSSREATPLASLDRITPIKLDAVSRMQPLPGGVERIFVAEIVPGAELTRVLQDLAANPDVEYAEPDYIGHGDGFSGAAAGAVSPIALLPGDPDFRWQWGLQNTGQSSGQPGIDVNAVPAWDITTGDQNTILAVLDSGIALTSPDFSGRLLPGYDFVNNDSDPADDLGHGTNVSSIAAATGANGVGIAGMNWKCSILPLKILNANNSGSYSWWTSAFLFAADHGAHVINISAGGTGKSQAMEDAITYAQAHGVIVVACMMNANNETPYYPAACPGVIAVGAVDNRGMRVVPFCYSATTGSNYGSHIAVVAPGQNILGINFHDVEQSSYWCGTSQATPFVSGLVALMHAVNPALTQAQAYSALKAGARDQVGGANEDVPGWDKFFGWGLVDSFKSLVTVVSGGNIFSQVAIGGGYQTVFTLLNTGADAAAGSLVLVDDAGNPLMAEFSSSDSSTVVASGFPVQVPSGGSRLITASVARSGDAARVGWARIAGSGGSLEGVATFQFGDGNQLSTVVGVLPGAKTASAMIPIDDDRTLGAQAHVTGYAVTNPGSEEIHIRITLMNPDGTVWRPLDPPALNPLKPGSHSARFVWQDLDDPNLKFRGSMFLSAQAGETFSVVALVLNQGLYTAIPIIPGDGSHAAATSLFAQVAIGGGYTTTFTLSNPGTVRASGDLVLTWDDGTPLAAAFSSPGFPNLVASSYPVTVAAGGSQQIVAAPANAGSATKAGWARVACTAGTLEGVATFQLAEGGKLTTLVGVLSGKATAAATIPIYDNRTLGGQSRETGYAVANPGSEDAYVRLFVVNPDGSIAQTLDPPAMNPLKPGWHVARFLWQDLNAPTLQFKGSMVLVSQGEKPVSVVALVLNQGLYTAIPVLPAKAPGIK